MKKFLSSMVALGMLSFFSLPMVSAEVPLPEDTYKWVQSSPRANYYFNAAQMCFEVDKDGMIDQNVLIVPIVKTYDPLLIRDVREKRMWKAQDMTGYDDLAGIAEYLRLDLAKRIVVETEVVDIDSTGSPLETRYPNRVSELDKLSAKSVDRIFYEAIIDYAVKHKDELVKRTKGTVKPEDLAKSAGKSDKNSKKNRK